MSYIDELKHAIRREHGCEAEHAATVPVREVFQGQSVWDGAVEVFEVRGHAQARRCFAWAHTEEGELEARYFTVLELPPIDSPQTAVKAALLREIKAAQLERGSQQARA
jgi:hypothetical protein